MPLQHEREKCARDRRTAATLADIADQIQTSGQLVTAAFMAVQDLPAEERAPLSALLDTVSARLKATAAILAQANQGDTDDVA